MPATSRRMTKRPEGFWGKIERSAYQRVEMGVNPTVDAMTSLRSAAVAFALGAIALAACRANTDLGQSCKLTQPCDAGTCAVAPDAVQNLLVDYIALGSAECDDLVCI